MRPLFVHYHFLKCAGTSVERILLNNFGAGWVREEFHDVADHPAALAALAAARPDMRAVSSHTLLLPAPAIPGVAVLPIVVLRHPLARILSAYRYQRREGAATRSAHWARTLDLSGYVRAHLADPEERRLRNFQTFRLAMATPESGSELARALAALAALPFVGVVERFGASLARLEAAGRQLVPSFRVFDVHANADASSPADAESFLRRQMRGRDFAALLEANADDLALHAAALRRFDT